MVENACARNECNLILFASVAYAFIYRAVCQTSHCLFVIVENQFSKLPKGTTPSSASVCVWQCKYVCAQLILGMTAKGTVKWEGHSWKERKKQCQLSSESLPKKKKKKKVCLPQLMLVSVTAAQSFPLWGTIWQRKRGIRRTTRPPPPVIAAFLPLAATFTTQRTACTVHTTCCCQRAGQIPQVM